MLEQVLGELQNCPVHALLYLTKIQGAMSQSQDPPAEQPWRRYVLHILFPSRSCLLSAESTLRSTRVLLSSTVEASAT